MKRLILTAVLAICGAGVQADDLKRAAISSETAVEYCETLKKYESGGAPLGSPNDAYAVGMCSGLVLGFAQMNLMTYSMKRLPLYCMPIRSSPRQHALVWVSYIEAHPEVLHEPMMVTFQMAMAEAFKGQC